MKKILSFLLLGRFCMAAVPPAMSMAPFEGDQKVSVQNAIVTQVNGTALSIIDIKKKLDVAFHQAYPHLIDSATARFQFYQAGWRQACMELIDHELILTDAEDREIKVADGEVREELENRFGPNVMITLDKVGISYSEAWKMIRNEMIVQRMMWYFVHSKALQDVTPQDLRQEYRRYLKENPPYEEWTYQVVSVRSKDPKQIQTLANEAYEILAKSQQSPDLLAESLKKLEENFEGGSITVSPAYTSNHLKLSDAHKSALQPLGEKEYGKPTLQTSRAENQTIARIFYLSAKKDFPAPSFEDMALKIKNDLLQKAMIAENERYLSKLRKRYGYDMQHLQESIPDTLQPFALQ